jgi:hypothetical protein
VHAQYPDVGLRVYAPVGPHKDLLAYLVRRLLENGANSSFVHQLSDESIPRASWRPRRCGGRAQRRDPAAGHLRHRAPQQ